MTELLRYVCELDAYSEQLTREGIAPFDGLIPLDEARTEMQHFAFTLRLVVDEITRFSEVQVPIALALTLAGAALCGCGRVGFRNLRS